MQKFISSSVFKTDLLRAVNLANELECGLEVSRFPFFKNETEKEEVFKLAKTKLKNLENEISVHAYFFDLNVASRDKELAELSQKRHTESLEFAQYIGAKTIVFHTGYIPFKHRVFQQQFTDKYKIFWETFIKRFENSDITAVIENVMENFPEQNLELVNYINSDKLKLSIDIGHVNAYSDVNIFDWIQKYNQNLYHMHIHNNYGDDDSHKSLTDGTLDIQGLFGKIRKLNLSPKIVFEIFEEEALRKSVKYFDELFKNYTAC